jgi:hypothetical protein
MIPSNINIQTSDSNYKKDEINKKIDDSFYSILKNLGVLFESVKFNDTQLLEEANNLDILSSTETISNRLSDLVKIVYEMKVDYMKRNEYDQNKRKEVRKKIESSITQTINPKLTQLQDLFNHTNSLIKESRHNKYYKYSFNYNFD